MRSVATLFTTLLLISISVNQSAHATGNVLLPDDNEALPTYDPTHSTPDPLLPSADPTATASPAPPSAAPFSAFAPPVTQSPSAPVIARPIVPAPRTGGLTAATLLNTKAVSAANASNTSVSYDGQNYHLHFPTTMLDTSDPVTLSMPKNSTGAVLIVSLSSLNLSDGDAVLVSQQLGIDKETASTLCSLAVAGTLQTDTKMFGFTTGTQGHAEVGYSGTLQSVVASITARCPPSIKLPENQGYVTSIGGFYAVDVGLASCPVAAKSRSTALVITPVSAREALRAPINDSPTQENLFWRFVGCSIEQAIVRKLSYKT